MISHDDLLAQVSKTPELAESLRKLLEGMGVQLHGARMEMMRKGTLSHDELAPLDKLDNEWMRLRQQFVDAVLET